MTLETFFEKFELFADAPDAVAKMRELVRHLAVTGKLVVQDPNDKPVEGLLGWIAQERVRLANKQGVRVPKKVSALTIDNLPHDIPYSWQWIRLGNLALVIDYGTSQKANHGLALI